MPFFQVGVQVARLARDPDNPDKEPVPPPLFRPTTLLFGHQDMATNANTTEDATSKGPPREVNTTTACIRGRDWSAQVGTTGTLSSDRFARYQLLTGGSIGVCGVGVARALRASQPPTPAVLGAATIWIAASTLSAALTRPKDDTKPL